MNIAIAGKMGSGKTTVARYLVDKYDYWKHSIADHIKEIAQEVRLCNTVEAAKMISEITNEYYLRIYMDVLRLSEKCAGMSNRWLYQNLGDLVRCYRKNAWLEYLYKQIADKPFVVIDDVRFKNEYDFFKEKGFVMVRVECSVAKERLKARDGCIDYSTLNHKSETELDNAVYDYVIKNDGTFEELYKRVDDLIRRARCEYID